MFFRAHSTVEGPFLLTVCDGSYSRDSHRLEYALCATGIFLAAFTAERVCNITCTLVVDVCSESGREERATCEDNVKTAG